MNDINKVVASTVACFCCSRRENFTFCRIIHQELCSFCISVVFIVTGA